MALSRYGSFGSRQLRDVRRSSRVTWALAGGTIAALLSVACTACGSGGGVATMKLSLSSGAPGTVVTVSGTAGSGCTAGKNWSGFDFEPFGDLTKGPVTNMVTPVLSDGSWTGTFAIPSYLGGSTARGPGALVKAGRYQFVASSCHGHKSVKVPFRVTTGAPRATGGDYVGITSTVDGAGYWVVQADGDVSAFGDARAYPTGATGPVPAGARIVGIARTYDAHGYWLASSEGGVYAFGDARSYGSVTGEQHALHAPITSIAPTPDGKGYWLVGANGTVYTFGDAHLIGAPNSYLAPYDAIGARPAGGYVVASANSAIVYTYPGGVASGGGPGFVLSGMLVGEAVDPSGNGVWEVGLDGGVITGGPTPPGYFGSVPGDASLVLKAPVIAIAGTPDGLGYWLLGADGKVFRFGDAGAFAQTGTTT